MTNPGEITSAAPVIGASLLALFLGALDALVMSTAMPTIVADLGGLSLFSWVYSGYFLARAVSLPIFGKLADLFSNKTLFLISTSLFLLASIAAGCAVTMPFLIAARLFQGIGAGGNFALVYIILSDISRPERRGRMLSLASSVWGISSVLGPSLGGFIVSYFSWRWIFFINVPIGLLSLLGIGLYLTDRREKPKEVTLDFAGGALLCLSVVACILVFVVGGRHVAWTSPQIILLTGLSLLAGFGFYRVERKARHPILNVGFFRFQGFVIGNAAPFFSSFAIFSLFAYAPLFIQGALGKTPLEVGAGMLSLSLGWSVGSLVLGQIIHRLGKRRAALLGSFFFLSGSLMTLFFSLQTTMLQCVLALCLVGLGMGFVTLATMLVVQDSVDAANLGVATSSNQFFRTLGSAVGVGVSGGFVTGEITRALQAGRQADALAALPPEMVERLQNNIESLFQPEIQSALPPSMSAVLNQAVVNGVSTAFWIAFGAALLSLGLCFWLPESKRE